MMKGMIPVHPREIEAIKDLVRRALAPTITYSESVANMRESAALQTRQHLKEIDDHLDDLATRTPA